MDRMHADRMDRFYRLQRHVYDLTRPLMLPGRSALVRDLDVPRGGSLLEIGCGTARNLVHAGALWSDARLHGLDISEVMLRTARSSIAAHGMSGRTELAQGDADEFDPRALFGVERFDRIMFSYTLSMMPPWRQALRRAVGMLREGGTLHVVDFGRFEGLPRILARLHAASGRPHQVFPRRDLLEVLEVLAADAGLRLDHRSLLRGYACIAMLRRP
jgi:S-adenosylmethionine-diacylgycerolhomoserine-N-methlytransferase